MKQLRKRIIGLLESGSITDTQEKENLERLVKTKKWNPYCIRHSAITIDSDYLPEFALRKKARWVMNSKQPSRYIKTRMGNDLKQKILVQNGIITEVDTTKPTPTVADCARCRLVNPLENKYCSSCGYPLSVSAYEELKAADSKELNEIKARLDEYKRWPELTKEIIDQLQMYKNFRNDDVKLMLHMRTPLDKADLWSEPQDEELWETVGNLSLGGISIFREGLTHTCYASRIH